MTDHWFDALAVRSTRRQGLKAALAGAAALTLPLGRLGVARAANPNSGGAAHACQKGCQFTSHKKTRGQLEICRTNFSRSLEAGLAVEFMFGPYLGLVGLSTAQIAFQVCSDLALMSSKDRDDDCRQPDCPGFDPQAENGPCGNCATTANCICCPDPATVSGYTECNTVAYTCDPKGGCKRSGR